MKPFNYKLWYLIGQFWLAVASCFGAGPATEATAAYLECSKLPAETRPGVRYITLDGIDAEKQVNAGKVLSYQLNALSRAGVITPPHWCSDTLARISAVNYAPAVQEYHEWLAAYEKLGEREPYFGIITEVIDPHSKKTVVTRVDGGWLPPEYQKLKGMTASNVPIMRADWFIAHSSITPAYYQFAGVPATEAEWLKSLGLDAKVVEKLRANSGANLFLSGVTGKPRRIVWSQGPLGGVYASYDGETVDAERDPFRRPIDAAGLRLRYDASEWFAIQPNGLWRVSLYDASGKVQQTVPDKIAKDTSDPHGDGIVVPMLSCIRCHTEGGLKPFRDDQSKLNAKAPVVSYDPNLSIRVAEFYNEPRLQRQMAFDRETYTTACAKATGGMTPKELAEALAEVVRDHSYLPVTARTAARECGTDVDRFKLANEGSRDPVILNLIHDGQVLRGQWESSFAESVIAVEARSEK